MENFFAPIMNFISAFLYEKDIPLAELNEKYTDSQTKFVEIDDIQVRYKIEGAGDPLLLVHGTIAMLETWDGWTNCLKNNYKVIRLDITPFGLTEIRKDANYSDEMYVDFINKFVEKIGISSFNMAGNSLGGLITWKYALAYPEKTKKIILIDPAGFHDHKEGESLAFKTASKYPIISKFLSNFGTDFLTKKTLEDVYYDDSKISEEILSRYIDYAKKEGARTAFVERIELEQMCNDETLKNISPPTLVMWGNEDVVINVKQAEHFKKIPNVKFLFYDEMGHIPQEEIAEKSSADALSFLQEGG